MIDYEKLKKAHEMLMNAASLIESDFFVHDIEDLCSAIQRKLEELTKPKPKYAVGSTVWRLNDEDGVIECRVLGISADEEGLYFCDDEEMPSAWWEEEQLHPTREALIKAQVDYWQGMFEPCKHPVDTPKKPKECEHEPDGDYTLSGDPNDDFPTWECKKCGEYYR